MKRSRLILFSSVATVGVAVLALTLVSALSIGRVGASPATHGQSLAVMHLMKPKPSKPGGGGGSNLSYHGGTGGVGVETGQDKVYLVYFGSQWGGSLNQSTCPPNDASGQCSIQKAFFTGVGGSSWNASVTQYCEGVTSGTTLTPCTGTGAAANPNGVLAGIWVDNATAAPSRPSQTNLANEAIAAASHFGNTSASANTQVQYVINTSSGNSTSGFKTRFCAWHSSTTSNFGNIAYTNMPYITDAGASCGANFVNAGTAGLTDGITIVGGHEFAETETDIFPNGGWLDGSGAENGDKCAWISSGQGAAQNVSFSGGGTFPVQSLWSNAFNSHAGGCVVTYP